MPPQPNDRTTGIHILDSALAWLFPGALRKELDSLVPKEFRPALALALGVVIALWWYFGWHLPQLASTTAAADPGSGQFGDQFGAVNALFSSLALFLVVVTVLLQLREMKESRAERVEATKASNRLASISILDTATRTLHSESIAKIDSRFIRFRRPRLSIEKKVSKSEVLEDEVFSLQPKPVSLWTPRDTAEIVKRSNDPTEFALMLRSGNRGFVQLALAVRDGLVKRDAAVGLIDAVSARVGMGLLVLRGASAYAPHEFHHDASRVGGQLSGGAHWAPVESQISSLVDAVAVNVEKLDDQLAGPYESSFKSNELRLFDWAIHPPRFVAMPSRIRVYIHSSLDREIFSLVSAAIREVGDDPHELAGTYFFGLMASLRRVVGVRDPESELS